MYLFNSKTGELKQANKVSFNFEEITPEMYHTLQEMDIESRIGALPDLDINRLNANYVKVGDDGRGTNIKPEGVESNGSIIGKDGATTTMTLDAKAGTIDMIGNITAAGGDFKTKPTTLDAKGVKSTIATMNDIVAAGGVSSVNGKVGAVVLAKADVGLGNVQNLDQTNADNIASGTVKVGVNTTKDISTTGQISAGNIVITGQLIFTKA